jgi:endonuclease/exonuclease/phosphatase family metal-dependent hydrolase
MISFILFVLLSQFSFAQELKVLTWNVHMIPRPVSFSKQEERTQYITNALQRAEYDIIFLQEAFSKSFRKDLSRGLKHLYPYQRHLNKSNNFFHFVSSGLMVMSKIPFKVLQRHYFKDCIFADCFSSKGILLVEFHHQKKLFQAALTHMQAWPDQIAIEVRKKQLAEIRSLLNMFHKSGTPQILIGDLNINGLESTEYPQALLSLSMTSTPLEGLIKNTNSFNIDCFKSIDEKMKPLWLDHIWLRESGTQTKILSKKVREFSARFESGKSCSLTDHNAVEAIIRL